jgi:hypothetical protein
MENFAKNNVKIMSTNKDRADHVLEHGDHVLEHGSLGIMDHKDHDLNEKKLVKTSNLGKRLEKAFYGLTVPKTVTKRKNVSKMVSKKEKIENAQVSEQTKIENPKESGIDSEIKLETKKEMKEMKKQTKKIHKKQRKGKSLLTAFRINRMEKRLTLNLARTEIKGKYV